MNEKQIFSGNLVAQGKRFGIVVARFNDFITSRLVDGALDSLSRHGTQDSDIDIAWCPGAFEIPLVAKRMLMTEKYDAIICLGCVIRGSTPHFDFVANEVSKGIGRISLDFAKPVIFGVLTTDTIEQAIERAGTKAGNKGFDAATSAVEMVNLLESL
ncbi:6,7-dimethyl-8-ribityllumazine synthase [Pleomorphochaeta sp. DL1XJH-081]|uniref:6,7-dimethyl-8-ribityllumazine synthase n=1 Tax=Pleomorphochaeta sp. DL1XJH-081 TaxID=3409690 RepID=UPI003BB774CF